MAADPEAPLPRGVGRVPQWWMDITPHDTLYLEEEEQKRQQELAEAQMYAQLAAKDDLAQKYGGEGFPNWDPAVHGPRTTEEEEEWIKSGYKRSEDTGKWIDENGEQLTGRQFKGQFPPGYIPGSYGGAGLDSSARGGGVGQAGLNSAKYGRDEKLGWSQPSWTKMKLRSTGNRPIGGGGAPKSPKPEPAPAPAPAFSPKAAPVISSRSAPAFSPKSAPAPLPLADDEEEVEEESPFGGKMVKRIRRKKVVKKAGEEEEEQPTQSTPGPANEPPWVKARREKEEAAAAAAAAEAAAAEERALKEKIAAASTPKVTEPDWVRARREKAEAAAAAAKAQPRESEMYEEEIIEEEIIEDEEYDEEEIIEEIIVEDEHGNIIEENGQGTSVNISALQNVFQKRANEQQLLR